VTDHLSGIDAAVFLLRERVSAAVASASISDWGASPTLGEVIKARRKAQSMSLDDVAQAAGCTKSHVWEMEQDRSRNPTVAMVYGLAKALGVPFPIMAAAALATHLAAQSATEQ